MPQTVLFSTALAGVFLLLFLVIRTKLPAFVALLLVSMLVGIGAGMPLNDVLVSIETGMGGTLGFVAIVVGLGAMFGHILEASGGAERLAQSLIYRFGEERSPWALGITGFLIAIPVFFDVGLIILIPIVYKLTEKTGRSLLFYGIPLLAGLAVTHSFIPPTPGPVAVAELIGADIGWVILFGILAGIPSVIIAGPLFGKFIAKKIDVTVPTYMDIPSEKQLDQLPDFNLIASIILTPLVLILMNTFSKVFLPDGSIIQSILTFIGHPFTALIIATLLAFYFLGVKQGFAKQEVQLIANKALEPAGVIILVTGAGGVFKQILFDSGVGFELGKLMTASTLPSVVLAFLIAVVIRIAQGSATVSMVATASLIAPLITDMGLQGPILGLIVIAIASGATTFSHVNDSGFWLVNRYFGLSVNETFLSWTVMETIVGIVGFLSVLFLTMFVA